MKKSADRSAYDQFRKLRADFLVAHAKVGTAPGSRSIALIEARDDLRHLALTHPTGDFRAHKDKLVMLTELVIDEMPAEHSSRLAEVFAALMQDTLLLKRAAAELRHPLEAGVGAPP